MIVIDIVSILLILLTIVSYAPQYHRMLTLRSSAGVSITSTFLNTLVAQVQVVTMHFLFKLNHEMTYGLPIETPPSTRDWLNLAQILIQWLCSMLLFALVLGLPSSTSRLPGDSAPSSRCDLISKNIAFFLWFFHVVGYLFTLPAGGRKDIFFNIILGINAAVITPLFTVLALAAVVFQGTMAAQVPGALSKTSLAFQAAVYLLLAISWPFRLIISDNKWKFGSQPALILEWYPWVGWACVNNAIFAVGQGLVLFVVMRNKTDGNTTVSDDAETQPLLR